MGDTARYFRGKVGTLWLPQTLFFCLQNVAIRLSGMTKKAYIHAFKTIECVLGKQKELTIKDLAVQFGCMEASNLAHQIYQRQKSCSESVSVLNLTKDASAFKVFFSPHKSCLILFHRRNLTLLLVTSAKQCRDPFCGPPMDSTNYQKSVSNFPLTWWANQQWLFRQANYGMCSNSGTQVGPRTMISALYCRRT